MTCDPSRDCPPRSPPPRGDPAVSAPRLSLGGDEGNPRQTPSHRQGNSSTAGGQQSGGLQSGGQQSGGRKAAMSTPLFKLAWEGGVAVLPMRFYPIRTLRFLLYFSPSCLGGASPTHRVTVPCEASLSLNKPDCYQGDREGSVPSLSL